MAKSRLTRGYESEYQVEKIDQLEALLSKHKGRNKIAAAEYEEYLN